MVLIPASHRPATGRLIPKSMLGISIWVTVLLDKYLFYRPTYRLLADWRSHGLDLSLGTLTDGLKRMVPLLEPVYEALVKRSQGQRLWHADETRWLVFVMLEGKVGYRWYLWVFHSREVVIFIWRPGGRTTCLRSIWGRWRVPGSWWWTVTRRTKRSTRSKAG